MMNMTYKLSEALVIQKTLEDANIVLELTEVPSSEVAESYVSSLRTEWHKTVISCFYLNQVSFELQISALTMLFIINFALFLNYLKHPRLKKTVQLISYAPHFISTVVICGMIILFTTPETGVFNILREMVGLESVNFLAKPEWFKSIYVWSGVWQGMGWNLVTSLRQRHKTFLLHHHCHLQLCHRHNGLFHVMTVFVSGKI